MGEIQVGKTIWSPCGVLRESAHYFTAAMGESCWKTSKWLWFKQPTLAALLCLLQEIFSGGNSANTFHLLCLLSPSTVSFVVLLKIAHACSSSVRLVMAVVWHWKGYRYTCVSFLADFSISDHWKRGGFGSGFTEVTPTHPAMLPCWTAARAMFSQEGIALSHHSAGCFHAQRNFSVSSSYSMSFAVPRPVG